MTSQYPNDRILLSLLFEMRGNPCIKWTNKASSNLRLFRIWRKASATVFEHVQKDIESYNIEIPHFMILELIYN
ncbi:hypothetical protein SAMN04487897_13211 [Paenibacillus sp. yr247]|nr:hypothetical protein SAMN04487897_13211 [Paenibacillus sp. yr247]